MSARDEFDRHLSAWMADAVAGPPPVGRFEEAMAASARQRPRRRWFATLGSDWAGGTPSSGLAWAGPDARRALVVIAILGLLVAAMVGAAIVGGQLLRSDAPRWRVGALAYDLDGDVYFADANGTNPRRVLDGVPAWVDGVRTDGPTYGFVGWAPDGRHILFVKDVGARSQQPEPPAGVLIGDADGRVVATIPGIGGDATWSPDSTRIEAWVGNTIGIYGTDGTQQTSLRLPDGYERWREWGGVWAPDGRFVWVKLGTGGTGEEHWQLPIDGTPPRHLAANDIIAGLDLPRFSRDGRRVAGISRSYLISGSLVVANADGTDRRRVVEREGVSDLIWSPSGTQIAYIRFVAVRPQATRDELRVVDLSSGEDRVVASLPDEAVGTSLSSLLGWSPGGDEIMLGLADLQGRSDLYAVNIDTGGWEVLAEGASNGGWQWIRADRGP